MVHRCLRVACVAVCVVSVQCPVHAAPDGPSNDARLIQGLWSGSWGGGDRDGVVFQPVIAELVIAGDKVEFTGFPKVGRLAGTVRFDTRARRMRVTPAPGDGPAPTPIDYKYELDADKLTLTGSDELEIFFHRHAVVKDPLADVQVEFVTADQINEAGDLLITEFTALEAGQAGATYFQPQQRKLATRQGAVFLVQETGVRAVGLDDARGLMRKSTPVVVAFRPDDRPPPQQFHELWKDTGPSPPESAAVQRTIARLVRPGTLIFVLSARENLPVP